MFRRVELEVRVFISRRFFFGAGILNVVVVGFLFGVSV